MSVREIISTVLPAQRHLKAIMPKLRTLRTELLALRASSTMEQFVKVYELISQWEEPGLMELVGEYEAVNFVGDFDKVLKELKELQQCFNDALAGGIMTDAKGPKSEEVITLSEELRDRMIALLGDLEFADSLSRI